MNFEFEILCFDFKLLEDNDDDDTKDNVLTFFLLPATLNGAACSFLFVLQKIDEGGCYSSVVSSAPTILWPWVQIPSTPTMLFQFVSLELYFDWEKDENKRKRGRDWPIFKKSIIFWHRLDQDSIPWLLFRAYPCTYHYGSNL